MSEVWVTTSFLLLVYTAFRLASAIVAFFATCLWYLAKAVWEFIQVNREDGGLFRNRRASKRSGGHR